MILTDVKIVVTDQMMSDSGMTKYNEFGIPSDPKNVKSGLVWKKLENLNDDDFDKIEEYFLNKTRRLFSIQSASR